MSKLEAGRELDAQVAKRVMGLDPMRTAYEVGSGGAVVVMNCAPHYSTDIAAAWEVVEKMRQRWSEQANAKAGEPDVWRFFDCADEGWAAVVVWLHHDGENFEHEAQAETLPLAICRAALRASLDNQNAGE